MQHPFFPFIPLSHTITERHPATPGKCFKSCLPLKGASCLQGLNELYAVIQMCLEFCSYCQLILTLRLKDKTTGKGVLNQYFKASAKHLTMLWVHVHTKQSYTWIFLLCPFPKYSVCSVRSLLCCGEKTPVLHSSS